MRRRSFLKYSLGASLAIQEAISQSNESSNEVIHDTGKAFNPQIPGNLDQDTHKPRRHAKRVRIKRRRNGKKEVTFPPKPTIYPLDPVPSASGQASNNPGVKVSGYVHTVEKPKQDNPPPLPPPTDDNFGSFFGNMVLFCVDGCPEATFYQFYSETISFSNKAEKESKSGWKYDTIDGKPGKYRALPKDPDPVPGVDPEPAMFDAPGQWGQPPSSVPPLTVPPHAGDTMTRTDEFKTFVCCDGGLIGYWTWEQTITYIWEKTSAWSEPSVTPAAPTWNADITKAGKPAEMLAADKLCSGK